MAIEVAIGLTGYGDDLLLTSTGDLLLVQDAPGNPAASIQILTRIVLTNPILLDGNSNPVGRPDDLFAPSFGSGIRRLIGAPLTSALIAQFKNQIIASIAASAQFLTQPAPSVNVYYDNSGSGSIQSTVSAMTLTGQAATTPPIPISVYAITTA